MRFLFAFLLFCTSLFASDLECRGSALFRLDDQKQIAHYTSSDLCEQARASSSGGVVCVWFTPAMPVGPESWKETGWRPMNVETGVGHGRKTVSTFEECLTLSSNASGGIVCTQTGLGYKPTNIETGLWCGSSSQIQYCTKASKAAVDFEVCSFPSDGTGAEAGWVATHISDNCDYHGSKGTVETCNASIQPQP